MGLIINIYSIGYDCLLLPVQARGARWHCIRQRVRSYKQERTAVTQALEVAVIERVGSELDSEPDLTICSVCFILPKPMNMSTVK